jgi:cation transport regulator ChaB
LEALSHYGPADNDAAAEIATKARLNAPTATDEEIIHFIHQKGTVTLSGKIDNPIGYLIVYVPKCFIGDTLQHYRDQERRRREASEQEAAEAHAWAAEHRRQQEQILADPDASEEDKRWARRLLSEEGN